MKLKATDGICLIEPLESNRGEIVFTSESKGKIGRGKVISCGRTVVTDFGARIECPVSEGDIVYFLRYESGYDESIIDGKTYVWALFRDIRGVEDM